MTLIDYPPPNIIGLPEKYTEWRPNQDKAVQRVVHTDKRVSIMVCPTGFGKSLAYVAAAMVSGVRCVILTSTKGLQTQLMNDFSSIGMVDVRGRNAYKCVESGGETTCEEGICTVGIKCHYKDDGQCEYFNAVEAARRAKLVVTNYAYWLSSNAYSEGIGIPGILVCDEGHDADSEVASFLTITLSRTDGNLRPFLPTIPERLTIDKWADWADDLKQRVADELELLTHYGRQGDRRAIARGARLRKISQSIEVLATITKDNWIVDTTPNEVVFSPKWASEYCQKWLFGKVRKIILTSASICQKSADLLGVSPSDVEYIEYPHIFPVENRLLTHVPTTRMNHRMTSQDMEMWLKRIDYLIKYRLDRKGIIHTVSYERRNKILTSSEYRTIMVTHDRKDTERVVREFKAMSAPAILVSPSLTTGWDFPYEECEYQIIGKIAYPDTRNKIVAARAEEDEDYLAYVAMQQLVQACGRGVRAVDDRCETIIIDDNIKWFIKRYGKFAPEWFTESYRSRIAPPEPPPKLIMNR